jgi:hypothetical protein
MNFGSSSASTPGMRAMRSLGWYYRPLDVWIYTGKDIPPLLPRPPEPYRTFSETFSY